DSGVRHGLRRGANAVRRTGGKARQPGGVAGDQAGGAPVDGAFARRAGSGWSALNRRRRKGGMPVRRDAGREGELNGGQVGRRSCCAFLATPERNGEGSW